MIQQNSTDFILDDAFSQMVDTTWTDSDLAIDFDEIASLVEGLSEYDNTKLMENNGVNVDLPALPCAVSVMMEPASPSVNQLFLPPPVKVEPASPYTELQPVPFAPPETPLQLASPGTLLQPSSPGTTIESIVSPYSSQLLSPYAEPEYLHPVKPEPFLEEPANTSQPYTVVGPSQSMLAQTISQPSVEPALSSYAMLIKEEASPAQTLIDPADVPNKRGRKRKYVEGTAPRRSRPKKPKVYEMEPLQDEKAEKKRRNAINAKLHRDKQKMEKDNLTLQLKTIIAERDNLQKQVEELKDTNVQLQLKLAQSTVVF